MLHLFLRYIHTYLPTYLGITQLILVSYLVCLLLQHPKRMLQQAMLTLVVGLGYQQCDQIGRYLKDPGNEFSFQSSPNM